MSKRYGAVTRIFCGLFGLFAMTLCPFMLAYGWDQLTAATFSKVYLAMLILGIPVLGLVFIYVAVKGAAPAWWATWADNKVLENK